MAMRRKKKWYLVQYIFFFFCGMHILMHFIVRINQFWIQMIILNCFSTPRVLSLNQKYQLYVNYVHLNCFIQHVYSEAFYFFIGCVPLKHLNLEDVLYIHKLNNDPFIVGLDFLIQKMWSLF